MNINVEWLHYVVANRDSQLFKELLNYYINYNVIVRKIANDGTGLWKEGPLYLLSFYESVL